MRALLFGGESVHQLERTEREGNTVIDMDPPVRLAPQVVALFDEYGEEYFSHLQGRIHQFSEAVMTSQWRLPQNSAVFVTLADMVDGVTESGSSHFLPGENHKTRVIGHTLFGGRFFIESTGPTHNRKFDVAWMYPNPLTGRFSVARLTTRYRSAASAREAARRLARVVNRCQYQYSDKHAGRVDAHRTDDGHTVLFCNWHATPDNLLTSHGVTTQNGVSK